jgi:hypothetical protein
MCCESLQQHYLLCHFKYCITADFVLGKYTIPQVIFYEVFHKHYNFSTEYQYISLKSEKNELSIKEWGKCYTASLFPI